MIKQQKQRKIGKIIGGNKYIHYSALDTLSEEEIKLYDSKLELLITNIPYEFNFNIIKLNVKENKISFIISPDWDTSSEPYISEVIYINDKDDVKYIGEKSKVQIYHHKWQFVKDDYKGFNVQQSKNWSEYWINCDLIRQLKLSDKTFSCKIGYKDYWEREVINKLKGVDCYK